MNKNFTSTFFWIAVFFFMDPGGFINNELNGFLFGLKYRYTFLVLMYALFLVSYSRKPIPLLQLKYVKQYSIAMFLWLGYYVVIFAGINSMESLGFLGGTSSQVINILIVYPII